MKRNDLIELLTFVAEEDAQVSNIYKVFITEFGYTVKDLDAIFSYALKNKIMVIESKNQGNTISWHIKNSDQEFVFIDFAKFQKQLFTSKPIIDDAFKKFID